MYVNNYENEKPPILSGGNLIEFCMYIEQSKIDFVIDICKEDLSKILITSPPGRVGHFHNSQCLTYRGINS